MQNQGDRDGRESALASGWTIQPDPEPASPEPASPEPVLAEADPDPAATPSDAGRTAVGPSDEPKGAEAAEEPGQLSNGALVLLGVFGGLYLLYAWVWLSWAQFYSTANSAAASGSGSLGAVLQQIVFWAAPLAPILWFVSVLLLNRGARLRRLALWIVVGAVVLIPLPMFSGGGS